MRQGGKQLRSCSTISGWMLPCCCLLWSVFGTKEHFVAPGSDLVSTR